MTRTHATTIALALLALALLAPGALAFVGSTQSLNATLLYYEPVPAEPGSIVDVYVQVTNTGSSSAKVSVAFVDTFPFTIDTESDRIKETPSIPSQQGFLVKYRVRVSPEAQPGTNYIKVQYYSDPATTQSVLLPIDVFSSDVSVAIQDVRVSPATITPGGIGRISVLVRNDGRLSISDGYIQLLLSGQDIVPYGTTDQQRLTGLAGGSEHTYEFGIVPSPSLEPGVYQIPIVLNFTDQRGTKHLLAQTLGLRVGAVPDVSVSLDEVTPGTNKNEADLILRVTNKGLGEIKFATVTLHDADAYDVRVGGDERYIGNIDSDDYKTARVPVTMTGDEAEIPVTLTYADAFNQPYEENATLVARLPDGAQGGVPGWLWAVIVIVVIAGVWLLLRRRGGKTARR